MKKQYLKTGIIGVGNMGGAIAKGISKNISPEFLMIYDIDQTKLLHLKEESSIQITQFIDEILTFSDIIILAVKPDIIPKILTAISSFDRIILSVAAGISIKTIQKIIGVEKKIIRAMPNTPAVSGAGMTVLSASENVSSDEINLVTEILSYTGKVLYMDEKHMNAVTAVSGSGPAYIFTFIQALADGAVKMGIPRKEALLLSGQTVFGSAKMFLDKMENPILLRDNVASPGGTTIDAIHVLEKEGFHGIVMDAVEAATKKAKELDKN